MEVILLKKVRNLGELGDRVKIKAGYGRNYLIPFGHAVPATAANVAVFEERRAELEKDAAASLAEANKRSEAVAAAKVVITSKAGDEGKLFGSIGPREVAEAFIATGVEVVKREVQLPEGPIRVTGEHEVTLVLHPEVQATVVIRVEEE